MTEQFDLFATDGSEASTLAHDLLDHLDPVARFCVYQTIMAGTSYRTLAKAGVVRWNDTRSALTLGGNGDLPDKMTIHRTVRRAIAQLRKEITR